MNFEKPPVDNEENNDENKNDSLDEAIGEFHKDIAEGKHESEDVETNEKPWGRRREINGVEYVISLVDQDKDGGYYELWLPQLESSDSDSTRSFNDLESAKKVAFYIERILNNGHIKTAKEVAENIRAHWEDIMNFDPSYHKYEDL